MPDWMKAVLGAFALVATVQAATPPAPADLRAPEATSRPAATTAAVAPAVAAAGVQAAGGHPSALLWRALALAVGAGVAWGLYRLGRGAAPHGHGPTR